MRWYKIKEYILSVWTDPYGIFCSKCGKLNDLFDDLTWFYGPKPICKKCHGPLTGDR